MLVALILQGCGGVLGELAGGLFYGYGSSGYDMGDVFGKEFLFALWRKSLVTSRQDKGRRVMLQDGTYGTHLNEKFQQLRPLVGRAALKVEDIVGKAPTSHFLPASQSIINLFLVLSNLGSGGMGLLLLVRTRWITANDLNLAYRSSQCLLGTIVQMSLLLWGWLGIRFLPLNAGIGTFLKPVLAQSRGVGVVPNRGIGDVRIGRQGHASGGHGERGQIRGGGIGGSGRRR